MKPIFAAIAFFAVGGLNIYQMLPSFKNSLQQHEKLIIFISEDKI